MSTAASTLAAPAQRSGGSRESGGRLRNVAIVAHVDHGKTTLVDAMLRASGAFGERAAVVDRIMDSGDLEREKGITILAKHTAIAWHGMTLNVVDTPGHADFGGEVERGLSMVDGVVLLVDASEGPLPQTRFVLRKTLAAGLPVVLVVNKTDRPDARCSEVVNESLELLLELADELDLDEDTTGQLLDLPVVYASGRAGRASRTRPADGDMPADPGLEALFDVIAETVPPPADDPSAPLQAHVTNLDATSFLGRIALCRVRAGVIRRGQQVAWCQADGKITRVKITELLRTEALERVPADSASAGDLVAVAGIADVTIGDTLADPEQPGAAAAHPRRRAGDLGHDRHQHLAARRPRPAPGHEAHRPAGEGPPRRRARGQRVAARAAHRAPGRLGGAGPRRAGAGRARGDDAPGGLRDDRRQARGRHAARSTASCTSRSSSCRRTCRPSTSAPSPSCSPRARASWCRWCTATPGCGWTTGCPRAG